ncbi:MAG: tetratricopeptide repeat protein [Candidatus Aceula meridiana]|nr:tetratricopeptide repeat protein [Candidatus Aceula meridiana]
MKIELKPKILKKIDYFVGMLAIGILAGLIIFLCNSEVGAFDIWLHLKTGEFIAQHNYIPTVDIFSCAVGGNVWNNHEWLFQLLAHFVFSAFSYDGLITMQASVIALTMLLLLFLGDIRDKQLGTAVLLLCVMMVYRTRFNIRPDIFSLLFFTSYIYILSLYIDRRWSLFALGFIQVLWVNTHGFFIFGPLFISIGLLSEFLKRRVRLPWEWNKVGRLEDKEYFHLKIALGVTLLACLCNPQFLRGAFYPFQVLFQLAGESRVFFSYIIELRKPILWSNLFSTNQGYFKALIIISFYSFIVNRRKVDISALFLWVFFLILSLQALRNMVFFAFVAYFVCFANFSQVKLKDVLPISFKSEKFRLLTMILLKVLLIAWIFRFGDSISRSAYYDFDKYEMKSSWGGVSLRRYPEKAADFILKSGISGNLFNDFNSGAYLIGRCFPQVKVFIDGRTELYGPEFFKIYKKVWESGSDELREEALEKYKITAAFLNSTDKKISKSLLTFFYENEQWIPVYLNYDGMIFLKDISKNQEIIKEHRLDRKGYRFKNIDLNRIGPRKVPPFKQIKRAYTLQSLDLKEEALGQVEEGLLISPGHSDFYYLLGRFYFEDKSYEEAFENFRIATMITPSDSEFRFYLALSYAEINDYENAIKQFESLIKNGVKKAKVFAALANTYVLDNQYDKALEFAQKALDVNPMYTKILKVADTFFDKEEFILAQKICLMTLKVNPRLSDAYYKIGLCHQKLKNKAAANEVFRRGLKIDPTNEEIKKQLKIK